MANQNVLTPSQIALGMDSRLVSEFASFLATSTDSGLRLGRVVSAVREIYLLESEEGEISAQPAGKLRAFAELPVVGDWVAFAAGSGQIVAVLPRRSQLSRKVAGREVREQVVAANMDVVLLVMGLDQDYNLNRLERFSVMAWESGGEPVVVLTKADLDADVAEARRAAEERLPGIPVLALSALHHEGLGELAPWLLPGRTLAMLGSSGAGKSTLANALLGEERLLTGAVSEEDGKGRHTTTRRELLRLPCGAFLLDNPGVREIQLWSEGGGLEEAFGDIAELAAQCRFADCGHHGEPGCAVRAALRKGRLAEARLESYFKLEKEVHALELRQDVVARRKAERGFGLMSRQAQQAKKRRF